MLINGEDAGGFSLGKGKPAEQVRFFSTEVCGADFHQKSVRVVESGSRPVKRARLLSDTDIPAKEAEVSSFARRGLGQGDFLEESNGDFGGMSQAHQGYEPISESSSVVTNGFRSRSAGMKVTGPIHASEYANGVNTKTVFEQKSGAKEDENRVLLNHGNINGNESCMIHSKQEDADDTTSTSGYERLFVIQVRSPTSKQLLHGRNQSNDQEELHSCNGQARSKTVELHDPPHNHRLIDGSNRLYSGLSRNSIKEAEITDMEGLVTEQVENRTPQVHEFVLSDMGNPVKVVQEAFAVGMPDTKREVEGGVNSAEILNVYVRKRKRSTAAEIATVDSVPSQEYGCSQSEDLVGERVIKHYVRRPHRQTDSYSPADMIEKPSEHVMTPSSNGRNEAVNSLQAEHRSDTSARDETEGIFNVLQRRSKMSQFSQAGHHADVSTPKADVSTPKADVARVESEGIVNVFQRRSKMKILADTEHHTDISGRDESEGNLNVFQRRSKMNHVSQAEHHADISTPKVVVARVEGEGNLKVFQRRPIKNQLPEAEHHAETPARVETEGNLNVFQRRSKVNHLSQAEHHVDISKPKADVAIVESEGNLNVFQRRSKKNQLPEAEHHADVSVRVETEGKLNVFQRHSKKKPSQKERSRNDSSGLQKEVNEKHTPAGYVRADHQPEWLPEGWTLEIREGKSSAHPRDKYYHDNKLGRIFRSKNEVLQFLVDGKVGGGPMMSFGSGLKAQSQNKKRPPVPIAPAKQAGFQSPFTKPSLSTQTGLISHAAPIPPFTHMHPAPMRSASAVSSEGNGTGVAWTQIMGPNGPVWIPWVGAIGTGSNTGERCQGDTPGNDVGAAGFHGGAANSSQLLCAGDGIQLPDGSPVSTVKSPSDQGDKENRGKLIFRLKRKQPDSEGGKGRSKRPMYEVVHREKASSSTSTPTNQEKKLTTGERTGQDVPPTPGSMQMHLQRISSVKEFLSPNVVSGSMPVKAQVEKHIPLEKPSFTSPSPLVMPTVDRPPGQSVATSKVTSFERPFGVSDLMSLEHSTMSNWGIKHNPLQHPSQHLELLQQEPYTALGIPATISYSGLQQMASYSANHTHVFLDPVDNTIPLSWQYPFTSQVSTSVTASVPTLGPFPSTITPSVPKTFSNTVPVPVFENYPGVSSFQNLNATATMFPCSESGVDSRTRDSANNEKLAEGGPQVHKAPKAPKAPKPLTKVDHTKLFLDLGRRLCLAGVEQKTKNPKSVGPLKPPIGTTDTGNKPGGEESSVGKFFRPHPGCSRIGR